MTPKPIFEVENLHQIKNFYKYNPVFNSKIETDINDNNNFDKILKEIQNTKTEGLNTIYYTFKIYFNDEHSYEMRFYITYFLYYDKKFFFFKKKRITNHKMVIINTMKDNKTVANAYVGLDQMRSNYERIFRLLRYLISKFKDKK